VDPTQNPIAAEPSARMVDTLVAIAPQAALALGALLVGLAASAAAGWLTRAIIQRSGLEGLAERAGVSRLLYAVGLRIGLARLLGRLMVVLGILITAHVKNRA